MILGMGFSWDLNSQGFAPRREYLTSVESAVTNDNVLDNEV